MRKLLLRSESLVALTIVIVSVLIAILNPRFLSVSMLFNILRSGTVMGIFAISTTMIIIYGGVDVSFTYIAACSMYLTVRILLSLHYHGSVFVPFVVSGALGACFGLVNAFFISQFKLPTLLVTLGTSLLIQGAVVFFVGSEHIIDLPGHLLDFSKAALATIHTATGAASSLHPAILFTAFFALVGWFLLRKTLFGRGIYAIGGSRDAAQRSGLNIRAIEYALFGFAGLCAGVDGIIYASLNRQANPHLMVGDELTVIAAVVLGGASVSGGRGGVPGALLGVLLITLLNNSLVLVGVGTEWQKVVIGAVIIAGTALPILLSKVHPYRGGMVIRSRIAE